ncbi:hypothetical protein ES703_68970 [subsurface metagenome]
MFYTFSHTVKAANTEANPHQLTMRMQAGVIHQVDILFQDGCNHEVYVRVFDENHQVWPTNRGEKLRANATVISFREFYELWPGNSTLTALIWTDLTANFKEVIINVGLLPKRIIQPMSFDELLAAAAGIE